MRVDVLIMLLALALPASACVTNPYYEAPGNEGENEGENGSKGESKGSTGWGTSSPSTSLSSATTGMTLSSTTLSTSIGTETETNTSTSVGTIGTSISTSSGGSSGTGGVDCAEPALTIDLGFKDAVFYPGPYPDCLTLYGESCGGLNFGSRSIAKLYSEQGKTSSLAILPNPEQLANLFDGSKTVLGASLSVHVQELLEGSVEVKVGVINMGPEWIPGMSDGAPPADGEATFDERAEMVAWQGNAGPGVASSTACIAEVPPGIKPDEELVVCDAGVTGVFHAWEDFPATRHGLVISPTLESAGVALYTSDEDNNAYLPRLQVTYCEKG